MQVGIPLIGVGSTLFGWTIVITQAIAGGLYVSVFFTLLVKNNSSGLMALGSTLAIFGNDLGTLVGTLVTGNILGKKATPETINSCCWHLSVLAFVGFILACLLKFTDRFKPKSDYEIKSVGVKSDPSAIEYSNNRKQSEEDPDKSVDKYESKEQLSPVRRPNMNAGTLKSRFD